MIKTIENILKQGGIEEYQAEAKMLVLEMSNLSLEDIILESALGTPAPEKSKSIE